jgi:hypothetical protein
MSGLQLPGAAASAWSLQFQHAVPRADHVTVEGIPAGFGGIALATYQAVAD